MGTEIEKVKKTVPQKKQEGSQLAKAKNAVSKYLSQPKEKEAKIPNASLIYGVASAVLFAASLLHLVSGQVVFALLLLLVGGLLFSYALFFIRSVEKKGRK